MRNKNKFKILRVFVIVKSTELSKTQVGLYLNHSLVY